MLGRNKKTPIRFFSENLCETKAPHELTRKQISGTIDPLLEEKLFVLSNFSTLKASQSQIIDRALTEFFDHPVIARALAAAYKRWATEYP